MPDEPCDGALSRRDCCVWLVTLVLAPRLPATEMPRLSTAHLADAERRFWEALLRDVLLMLPTTEPHSRTSNET